MRKYFVKLLDYLSERLIKQVQLVSNQEGVRFRDSGEKKSGGRLYIALLQRNMYISFDKKYKVISQKELKGIAENEMNYHSPFKNSKILYKCTELGEGNWNVTYYFIDLQLYPEIKNYKLILLADDLIRYCARNVSAKNIEVHSPLGHQLITLEEGVKQVRNLTGNSYKHRLLSASVDSNCEKLKLNQVELEEQFCNYFLSLSWLQYQGSVNREAFLDKGRNLQFNQQHAKIAAILLLTAISLESIYIKGMDYFLDRQIADSAALREEYATIKRQYLDKVDNYNIMAGIVNQRTDVTAIANVIGRMDSSLGVKIDRLDYLQGEFRLSGSSNDIQNMMAFLSAEPSIIALDFLSPITTGRDGKDQFSIRFELTNVN